MRNKVTQSFEELLKGYYGRGSKVLRDPGKVDELLASYYGISSLKKARKPRTVKAFSFDDGQVLAQKSNGSGATEYVVGLSTPTPDSQEYVVGAAGTPTSAAPPTEKSPTRASDDAAYREAQVDIKELIQNNSESRRSGQSPATEVAPAQSPAPGLATEPVATSQSVNEDDFLADMQSILSGQKVFDPVTKRTTDKESLQRQESDNGMPAPDAKNSQAIFDRIARSMQYANAYDLGTVELENRFASFDQLDELQEKASEAKKLKKSEGDGSTSAPRVTVDSEDFLQDLEAIRKERYGVSSPSENPPQVSLAESTAVDDYSRPLFDTGEHVLAAEGEYPDRLRVGQPPGVPFSYGQLIAMGDLYESVEQMMAAPPAELEKIKKLISSSTMYYKKNKSISSLDVSDDTWDEETGGRFLELAEKNYEHFSPGPSRGSHGTNKSEWERHHRNAIEDAQQAFLMHPNASVFPERALIINAFGDHFLTDAFAAGHLINKEAAIESFRSRFFNGTSLKPAAETFFEKLAKQAFRGEVRKKFSVLETYKPEFLWWNPNIDTENAFRKLLLKAAKEKPDAVANLAVRALHDKLNRDGIEVTNDAGDGKWLLKGDGNLIGNPPTLAVMKRAVKQSIDNINDPSIRVSNLNFQPLFQRVWKHVPRPVQGPAKLAELIVEYTSPDSNTLVFEAANIITRKVDSIIKRLLKEKYLKAA